MHLFVDFILAATAVAAGADAPTPKFEAQTIHPEVQIGYGVAIGDVDGDKKPDILLADKRQFVWFRNPGKVGERWPRFVMAENLTELDNVCLAAADINGDGKVEVAVGAQWNPSETSNLERSGAIFYLIRPADPTDRWTPVRIEPHDPTTHRMLWIEAADKTFALAVLPLHGKDNKDGAGVPVRVQFITPPENLNDPKGVWQSKFVDTGLHMTHNFHFSSGYWGGLVAGREGIRRIWTISNPRVGPPPFPLLPTAAGEVSDHWSWGGRKIFAISPMHGNRVVQLTPFVPGGEAEKPQNQPPLELVIDDTLREGHALGVADFLKMGRPQVVAGWRMPNAEKKVGIRMYVPQDSEGRKWATHVIDDNTMACEDLKIADLDGDDLPDIVASGRSTHNLVIYWNRTKARP